MGKTFAEYAAERATDATPEEGAWVAAFDAAYSNSTDSKSGAAAEPQTQGSGGDI
jgi:hypothetical protein